jgi:transcriptional regulator with AAA-type ATPase domain
VSTNGTFAGGLRVNDAYVAPGARIRLGQSELSFIPLDGSIEVELAEADRFHGLVGASVAMRRLYVMIQKFAVSDATVLVTGETGVGKELVAEAIHEASPRKDGPLVVLDCSAIPANLFENELFGHEKGAFTGATSSTLGAFARADGGTLFLDEVGELPLEVQPKLLRALESRRVRPIGGSEERFCNIRVVAATNRDLAIEVNHKRFRPDLYHRLAVARLHVPPLRDRKDDIRLLVQHFLERMADGSPRQLAPEVIALLEDHSWPGNARELRNAVERAVIQPTALALEGEAGPSFGWDRYLDLSLPFKEARRRLDEDFDRRFIGELLSQHNWNISAVSRAARLDRMTVYKMIERLRLVKPTCAAPLAPRPGPALGRRCLAAQVDAGEQRRGLHGLVHLPVGQAEGLARLVHEGDLAPVGLPVAARDDHHVDRGPVAIGLVGDDLGDLDQLVMDVLAHDPLEGLEDGLVELLAAQHRHVGDVAQDLADAVDLVVVDLAVGRRHQRHAVDEARHHRAHGRGLLLEGLQAALLADRLEDLVGGVVGHAEGVLQALEEDDLRLGQLGIRHADLARQGVGGQAVAAGRQAPGDGVEAAPAAAGVTDGVGGEVDQACARGAGHALEQLVLFEVLLEHAHLVLGHVAIGLHGAEHCLNHESARVVAGDAAAEHLAKEAHLGLQTSQWSAVPWS